MIFQCNLNKEFDILIMWHLFPLIFKHIILDCFSKLKWKRISGSHFSNNCSIQIDTHTSLKIWFFVLFWSEYSKLGFRESFYDTNSL